MGGGLVQFLSSIDDLVEAEYQRVNLVVVVENTRELRSWLRIDNRVFEY